MMDNNCHLTQQSNVDNHVNWKEKASFSNTSKSHSHMLNITKQFLKELLFHPNYYSSFMHWSASHCIFTTAFIYLFIHVNTYRATWKQVGVIILWNFFKFVVLKRFLRSIHACKPIPLFITINLIYKPHHFNLN